MATETTTNTTTPTREDVAYHEAVHTVMARALGLPVGEVTIVPDPEEGNLGSFSIGAQASKREASQMGYDYSALWRALLRTVGGPVAQVLNESGYPYAGPTPRIDLDDPSFGSDADSVYEYCAPLGILGPNGTVDIEHVLHEAEAAACGVLRSRWEQVEYLAEALMRSGTMVGEEVEALLEDHR